MLDWNDLRYFLAVAREGSTLAAGRALRTSQTTVARRVAALERALGLPLFEKRQAGYVLTPAGEELIGRATQVESSAKAFSEAATALAAKAGLNGTYTRPAIAITAARSPVAQLLLNGSLPVPIT